MFECGRPATNLRREEPLRVLLSWFTMPAATLLPGRPPSPSGSIRWSSALCRHELQFPMPGSTMMPNTRTKRRDEGSGWFIRAYFFAPPSGQEHALFRAVLVVRPSSVEQSRRAAPVPSSARRAASSGSPGVKPKPTPSNPGPPATRTPSRCGRKKPAAITGRTPHRGPKPKAGHDQQCLDRPETPRCLFGFRDVRRGRRARTGSAGGTKNVKGATWAGRPARVRPPGKAPMAHVCETTGPENRGGLPGAAGKTAGRECAPPGPHESNGQAADGRDALIFFQP